jgi:hypothetical protein
MPSNILILLALIGLTFPVNSFATFEVSDEIFIPNNKDTVTKATTSENEDSPETFEVSKDRYIPEELKGLTREKTAIPETEITNDTDNESLNDEALNDDTIETVAIDQSNNPDPQITDQNPIPNENNIESYSEEEEEEEETVGSFLTDLGNGIASLFDSEDKTIIEESTDNLEDTPVINEDSIAVELTKADSPRLWCREKMYSDKATQKCLNDIFKEQEESFKSAHNSVSKTLTLPTDKRGFATSSLRFQTTMETECYNKYKDEEYKNLKEIVKLECQIEHYKAKTLELEESLN